MAIGHEQSAMAIGREQSAMAIGHEQSAMLIKLSGVSSVRCAVAIWREQRAIMQTNMDMASGCGYTRDASELALSLIAADYAPADVRSPLGTSEGAMVCTRVQE